MVKRKKRTGWRVILPLALLGLAGLALYVSEASTRVIFGLRDDFRHAVPYQEVPAGIPGIRAEDCGECHQEIYEEWKTSYHAKAYVDPFFQAYWKKDNNIWICLNCHSPLENQQPWIIHGLDNENIKKPIKTQNDRHDPEFQLEGITCAACHVRNGVIEGPYEDSVAPHPTRYSPRFRSTDICYTCHQVPSGPFQFYEGGPCSTFPEFVGGPYAKQGYVCQSCHMPDVVRPVAVGGPVREGRRHLWRGGHDPEMIKQAVMVQLNADPPHFRPGEKVKFTVRVSNIGAGHKIPTGDPDRYFTILFTVTDESGKTVSSQTHTVGRWIIWKPIIWEVYDNRISPQQGRDYVFKTLIPPQNQPRNLRIEVKYHILTDKAYKKLQSHYGLKEEVPYVFTIYKREISLQEEFRAIQAKLQQEKREYQYCINS